MEVLWLFNMGKVLPASKSILLLIFVSLPKAGLGLTSMPNNVLGAKDVRRMRRPTPSSETTPVQRSKPKVTGPQTKEEKGSCWGLPTDVSLQFHRDGFETVSQLCLFSPVPVEAASSMTQPIFDSSGKAEVSGRKLGKCWLLFTYSSFVLSMIQYIYVMFSAYT